MRKETSTVEPKTFGVIAPKALLTITPTPLV